mgnify:CR=1 FL=1
MNNEFEIYEIKPNETLSQIAKRFEMSSEELQAFHNLHYKKAGLMWFSNFVGINKILVPTNYKSKAERKKEHQQNFPPKEFFKEFYGKKYTVKETFENSYKEISEIDYQLELQINEEKEEIVVQIASKNFTKRKNPVDDKISSIAIACMDAVNPIGFVLDNKGKLKKLAHPEVYLKRFSEKRPSLEDFFVGEVYQNYLDKFQESWKNPENIFEKFRSQLLYQLLFPSMNWFHKSDEWQDKKNLAPNSFPVKMNFNATYEHEETEFATTKITGTIAEEISIQDILRGIKLDKILDNSSEAFAYFNYFTNKKTKILNSADAKIILSFEDKSILSHSISITAMRKK